jgi:CRISPR-associated protein Cmr3
MIWLIEPTDPLLARDGRPFNATPGSRARSLAFPFPSTTAGAVRTRAGQDPHGRFDTEKDVVRVSVRGPLLVEPADDGTIHYFAPAPGDALLFDAPDDRLAVRRLTPLSSPPGSQTDLAVDLHQDLHVVGLVDPNLKKKTARRPPPFWRWERFAAWLDAPADTVLPAADLGIAGPARDRRTHVGIDPATLTGRDGVLFATSGLTFWRNEARADATLSGARRLALAVDISAPDGLSPAPGFGPMGGERRLMYWRQAEGSGFPDPPPGLRDRVMTDGHCRVILLTPACFAAGWRPSGLLAPREGVTPQLEAAIIGKPLTVSGWDLAATPPGPRASRRLAPSGSVLYLKLGADAKANGRWFDAVWMQCVSDTDSDNAAGFGLAAVGAWSGVPEDMNMEENGNATTTNK